MESTEVPCAFVSERIRDDQVDANINDTMTYHSHHPESNKRQDKLNQISDGKNAKNSEIDKDDIE